MTNLTSVIWNRLWRSRNINENMYTFWSARSLRSCLLKRILFITYGSSSQWLLIPLKIVFKCAKNATFKFYTLNLEKGPCRGREDTPLPNPPPVGRLLRALAEDLRQNDFVPPSRFCPSNPQCSGAPNGYPYCVSGKWSQQIWGPIKGVGVLRPPPPL